ncbi:MAG: methylenetetrahydrofolate reductase [Acidimicrobiales bacterium]
MAAARGLLEHPRYEVLPTASSEELVAACVPLDVTVTVTSSPSRGLEATLATAERLAAHGYRVVPHVAARQVVDAAHLSELAARLTAAGVTDVFVPAGDSPSPSGHFDSAYDVLKALDEMGRPFAEMGITAYPESHRSISDDVTIQSMWDKRHFATYMVSNLCFNPNVVKRWIRRVRARGVTLPLYFGLAGPVEQAKLVKIATKIGVGESARFASGHARGVLRLSTPGAYSPTRLLERAGTVLGDPASLVVGLHLFTFNQVAETEEWRQSLLGSLGGASAAAPGARRTG